MAPITAEPVLAVAAVVRDASRRLLVVRRGKPPLEGCWTLPGGAVEAGEHLREAVVREVREETGLCVEVGDLAWYLEHLDEDHHYVILDFHARPRGGSPRAGSDAREVRWVTRRELGELTTTPRLLELLDEHGVALA